MKKSKFTEEQIAFALQQTSATRVPVSACPLVNFVTKLLFSLAQFYRTKSRPRGHS